jgi:hypothetical protein
MPHETEMAACAQRQGQKSMCRLLIWPAHAPCRNDSEGLPATALLPGEAQAVIHLTLGTPLASDVFTQSALDLRSPQ